MSEGREGRSQVSVVMPCYCCSSTLDRAIASIVSQTRPPEEIILVDDASPDNGLTLSKLTAIRTTLSSTFHVTVIPLAANVGPGAARNAGWEAASRPFIAFLDADDIWHPRKLELQIEWMQRHPDILITGTLTAVLGGGETLPFIQGAPSKEVSKFAMLCSNYLPMRSVIVRSALPDRFLPAKRYGEDYLLWLQCICSGRRLFLLTVPLAFSFKRDFGVSGLSGNIWAMHAEMLLTYRQLRREGQINSAEMWFALSIAWLKLFRRIAITKLSPSP
jgi:glycosyltransferase involved in cell wall biosynthesis